MTEKIGTKGKSDKPCCVYDFRISAKDIDEYKIIDCLREISKKWCFQLEKGEKTGYEHYQGRFSLKLKKRKMDCLKSCQLLGFNPNYLEKTSGENQKNNFYVCKNETKISGPWKDTDPIKFITKTEKKALKNLYPFQQKILDSAKIYDNRNVNVIFCHKGNSGKSTVGLIAHSNGGIYLPAINDAKNLVQTLCDICSSREDREPSPIILDLPKAMDKKSLNEIFSAIEQIKNGLLYDTRYKYKEWKIESPQIWVFTNNLPNSNLLSEDRWILWEINDKNELIKLSIDDSDDE